VGKWEIEVSLKLEQVRFTKNFLVVNSILGVLFNNNNPLIYFVPSKFYFENSIYHNPVVKIHSINH